MEANLRVTMVEVVESARERDKRTEAPAAAENVHRVRLTEGRSSHGEGLEELDLYTTGRVEDYPLGTPHPMYGRRFGEDCEETMARHSVYRYQIHLWPHRPL